jgi:hypothetical protein
MEVSKFARQQSFCRFIDQSLCHDWLSHNCVVGGSFISGDGVT